MKKPIIHFQKVQITHKAKSPILYDLNINVFPGEFVFLVGQTGSGKTSFLRSLYADLPIHFGQAWVADYNLGSLKKERIPSLRRRMGIVFQDFQLLPDRHLFDNLSFFLQALGYQDEKVIKYRVAEILMKVDLIKSMYRMPYQLSGGEQQRSVIARALLNQPPILLADEPTGNLDPKISKKILKLFIQIYQKGTAILFATHDYQNIHFIQKQNIPIRILSCQDQTIQESSINNF